MQRRVPQLLKDKAVASLKIAVRAFNGLDDEGRQTIVLLHLQHSFEMLLKAVLHQRRVAVFDERVRRSIGFDACVRLGQQHVPLTETQMGMLRAIDAMRDDEQHWLGQVSEGLLYLHARGAVTLFDGILEAVFGERLADHLPERVLPVSTQPMTDLDTLVDSQFSQIQELLRPGKRRGVEARALIRGLLAVEGHVAEDAHVSERDVDRVQGAVKGGKTVDEVFPRLRDVGATFDGEGLAVRVHFTKKEGAPVRFVPADDPSASAAVREVDLQRKYHLTATKLSTQLGLTLPRCLALRRHLSIDDDPRCKHDFRFGTQLHTQYSDNATVQMKKALETVDMDEVWQMHGSRRSSGR